MLSHVTAPEIKSAYPVRVPELSANDTGEHSTVQVGQHRDAN